MATISGPVGNFFWHRIGIGHAHHTVDVSGNHRPSMPGECVFRWTMTRRGEFKYKSKHSGRDTTQWGRGWITHLINRVLLADGGGGHRRVFARISDESTKSGAKLDERKGLRGVHIIIRRDASQAGWPGAKQWVRGKNKIRIWIFFNWPFPTTIPLLCWWKQIRAEQ